MDKESKERVDLTEGKNTRLGPCSIASLWKAYRILYTYMQPRTKTRKKKKKTLELVRY